MFPTAPVSVMRAPRSARCPRCGFSFAWDGRKCGHCPPPSRARQLWEQIGHFPELVGSAKNIPTGALLAIALGCVRRAWDLLPKTERKRLEALEADPAAGGPTRRPRRVAHPHAAPAALDVVTVLADALYRSALDARTVQTIADRCARAVGFSAFPERDLLSYPLPPELEHHREVVAVELETEDRPARRRRGAREADETVRAAFEHLREQEAAYNRQRWSAVAAEAFAQCEIARDVLGYPEVAVAFDPAWRTSTAVAMARGMHESRDFSAMPILADALQDAGCEEPEILEHCRAEKPHFRGCWVVEMILGRGT